MSKSQSKSKKRAEKGMLVKWRAGDGRLCLCGLTNSAGGSADRVEERYKSHCDV